MIRKIKLFVGISLLTFLVPVSFAHAEDMPGMKEPSQLDECVSKTRRLQALFLVDESISLRDQPPKNGKPRPGNDPDDARVPALIAASRALASLTRGSDDINVKVRAALAGFGDAYTSRQDWTDLNDRSVGGFSTQVEAQKDRDSDRHTRYHKALEGALKSFDSEKSEACRLLIWFSDGLHDDDDKVQSGRQFSSREKKQISGEICGAGGVVDRLRENGVFVRAVGLNSSKSQMDLMRMIAEGTGSFKINETVLQKCGTIPASGRFTLATEANEIVDQLISVPGGPEDEVVAQDCEDEGDDCSRISFEADSTITGFKILITRPSSDVAVSVENEQCGKQQIFTKTRPACFSDTVLFEPMTPDKVLLDVTRGTGSIEGKWTITFNGPDARDAHGRVRFVGEAEVSAVDASTGKPITSLDRYQSRTVRVDAKTKSGVMTIQDVKASIGYRTTSEELLVEPNAQLGSREINGALIGQLLKSTFREAPAVDLVLRPVGVVRGLQRVDESNGPVEVSYKELRLPLSVTNGQGFPEYVPNSKSAELPRIDGTKKTTLLVKFKGPDTADGKVVFDIDPENELGFMLISGNECEIPQAKEVACELEVKPTSQAYGSQEVPLIVSRSTEGKGTADSNVLIPAEVWMTRKPNVSKGILVGVALIIAFLVIQGTLRLIFATLMSRFSPMSPTSRRARIEIQVDSDGTIRGTSNGNFHVAPGDENFASENIDSQREFNIFGYQFEVSVLKTFLKSTASPVGSVTSSGKVVIGSQGVQLSKDSSVDGISTSGLVSIVLPGQWVIGIKSSDIYALAIDGAAVSAELIAYLKSFDFQPLEDQLHELDFTLSSSNFSSDLSRVIERIREVEAPNAEVDEVNSEVDFIDASDPFAGVTTSSWDTIGETVAEDDGVPERKKRRRKDKNASVSEQPEQSHGFQIEGHDPFA